jgi:hypothetical protein
MNLYYDRVSAMFSLDTGEDVIFLGPTTHAMLALKRKLNLTDSQARQAVIQAVFNMGDAVNLDIVKKMASESPLFYKNATQHG